MKRFEQLPHKVRQLAQLNNIVIIVAVIITLSWIYESVKAIQQNFIYQQQVDIMAQENQLLELQNQNLAFQQKYYQSSEYLDLQARDKLGKASPGEKLINLPPLDPNIKVNDTPENTVTPVRERSNFGQWMYFLFGDNS